MAEPAPGSALPRDEDLLVILERAVEEIFSTMVCSFEAAAVFRCTPPEEHVDDRGEVDLELDPSRNLRLHIDREAVVEFRGAFDGRVVLRCSAEGALDIARGLLMHDNDVALAVEEVNDALKECANMLTGYVKTKALDPLGTFSMSIPFIKDAPRDPIGPRCGALVYRLEEGAVSIEIWRRAKPLASCATTSESNAGMHPSTRPVASTVNHPAAGPQS